MLRGKERLVGLLERIDDILGEGMSPFSKDASYEYLEIVLTASLFFGALAFGILFVLLVSPVFIFGLVRKSWLFLRRKI